MELTELFRYALALAFVLGLIGLAAAVVRRLGLAGFAMPQKGPRRLSVTESLSLDTKRRLLLVRCDGAEHLLMVGGASDLLISSNLAPPSAEKSSP